MPSQKVAKSSSGPARKSSAASPRRAKTSPRPAKISETMIIAMDGPAGSGKSTTARCLAERLKLPYLDTGAMYRAVTLAAMEQKVSFADADKLASIAAHLPLRFGTLKNGKQKVWIGARDVTADIRTPELTANVHHAASSPKVRKELVNLQRRVAGLSGGVIEGRDIGTVVFPNTPYKFYLDADVRLRARRRYNELVAAGVKASYEDVLNDQKIRDHRDSTRKVAPLKPAKDAIILDTTELTIPATADKIQKHISKLRPRRPVTRRLYGS